MIHKDVTVMPYFKSGCDMYQHLKNADDNPIQGLRNWADHLQGASEQLRELANQLEGVEFTIDADTHYVDFHGLPDKLIDKLSEQGFVSVDEWECEDELEFIDEDPE